MSASTKGLKNNASAPAFLKEGSMYEVEKPVEESEPGAAPVVPTPASSLYVSVVFLLAMKSSFFFLLAGITMKKMTCLMKRVVLSDHTLIRSVIALIGSL